MNYENKELCSHCKGLCCKRGGCDYSATDFEELKLNFLLSKLEEGYISIVSTQNITRLPNGTYVNTPFLYLRARNINKPVVDLLSISTTCKSLTTEGCKYPTEKRPSGGLNLIPACDEEGLCCYPKVPPFDIIKTWEPYQKILARLVKRLTNKTVEMKLKEDVEELFLIYLNNAFDGYDAAEVEDILNLIPNLSLAYPKELEKAMLRKKDSISRKREK